MEVKGAEKETTVILVLQRHVAEKAIEQVYESLTTLGLSGKLVNTHQHVLVIIDHDTRGLPSHLLAQIEGVEKVLRVEPPTPFATYHGTLHLPIF